MAAGDQLPLLQPRVASFRRRPPTLTKGIFLFFFFFFFFFLFFC